MATLYVIDRFLQSLLFAHVFAHSRLPCNRVRFSARFEFEPSAAAVTLATQRPHESRVPVVGSRHAQTTFRCTATRATRTAVEPYTRSQPVHGRRVPRNRPADVMPHVRCPVPAAAPVVRGCARGLRTVRRVHVAVRLRPPVRPGAALRSRLAGAGAAARVQVRGSGPERRRPLPPPPPPPPLVHRPGAARALPHRLHVERFRVPVERLRPRRARRQHRRPLRGGARPVRPADVRRPAEAQPDHIRDTRRVVSSVPPSPGPRCPCTPDRA